MRVCAVARAYMRASGLSGYYSRREGAVKARRCVSAGRLILIIAPALSVLNSAAMLFRTLQKTTPAAHFTHKKINGKTPRELIPTHTRARANSPLRPRLAKQITRLKRQPPPYIHTCRIITIIFTVYVHIVFNFVKYTTV